MHLFLSSFQDRSHHRDSMMVYFTRGSIFVVCVDKNGQTVSHMDAAVIVNTGKWSQKFKSYHLVGMPIFQVRSAINGQRR